MKYREQLLVSRLKKENQLTISYHHRIYFTISDWGKYMAIILRSGSRRVFIEFYRVRDNTLIQTSPCIANHYYYIFRSIRRFIMTREKNNEMEGL